jgi:hypothetical protein
MRSFGRAAGVTTMCLIVTLLGSACGSGSSNTSGSTAPHSSPASNGIASKTPDQILAAARSALASASSVHLRGDFPMSGQSATINVILTKAGAKGSMTGPFAGVQQGSFDFTAVGGKVYIRSSTLWSQVGGKEGKTLAALLNNRWVQMPSSSVRNFPMSNMAAFARALGTGPSDKALSVGQQAVIDGHPAIPVKTNNEIVYVATTGSPFPLRAVPRSGSGQSSGADFLDYNAPMSITAPAGALNFSNLHG